MKIKLSLSSVGLVALLLTMEQALGQSKEAGAFQARYDRFSRAFVKGDWSSVDNVVAPGYTAQGPTGKAFNWPQIKGDFARLRTASQTVTWPRKVLSVSLNRDQALVTVAGHLSAVSRADKNGKTHSFVFDATTLDTWARAAGVWKLKASKLLKHKMTVDRKPVPGS